MQNETDLENQINAVENFITHGIDAIVLAPADQRQHIAGRSGAVSRRGLPWFGKGRERAARSGAPLGLTYVRLSDPAASPSAGNRQKVVLAKWLAKTPKILLTDEPNRGVDLGAFIIGMRANGLILIGLSGVVRQMIAGRVVVIAVILDNYRAKYSVS
ncbi:hypothetical protein [Roseobacter sinensis]|uniref:hypothetical protein n=1 Tax=Roseobacter sinensis TaxID=2931391 RepID=UPI002980C703|nr:hypothetical protein [Roseobacter sp. WL0113]